jgi:hypothetical protein
MTNFTNFVLFVMCLGCVVASRLTRKKRKFDVHACEAGMNIKFPGLHNKWFFRNSRGKPRILGYESAYALSYPKMRPSLPRKAPGQAGKYQTTSCIIRMKDTFWG